MQRPRGRYSRAITSRLRLFQFVATLLLFLFTFFCVPSSSVYFISILLFPYASVRSTFLHEFQVRANEAYSEAKRQFSDRNRDVILKVQSSHKWWSTLKTAVFGSSSSLPPLVSEGGGLVCESVGKADQLSDHFRQHESREAVDLPLTCQFLLVLPPLPLGRGRSGVFC